MRLNFCSYYNQKDIKKMALSYINSNKMGILSKNEILCKKIMIFIEKGYKCNTFVTNIYYNHKCSCQTYCEVGTESQ